jgi:YbbR domain-containing protein
VLGWLKLITLLSNILKKVFLKNLGKKTIAFIVALSLWLVTNVEQNIERSISTEVSYANLPSDLVIMNKPPETLNIRVRGPRNRIASLSYRDISLSLDLCQASTGISRFDIQTEQIKSPKGIQVVSISPAEIKLDVDKVVEKKVNVQPIIGLPDAGYEIVGEPEIVPSEVRIRGPERVLSKIKSMSTDLVLATGVRSKFKIEVPLEVPPRVEIVGGGTVQVTVNIEERTVVKEFKNIDIDLINFDNLTFEPLETLKAAIEFEGPYSIIKGLKSKDIKAFVDGSDLTKSNGKSMYTLKVSVDYPYSERIKLKKKIPDEVEIKLK